MPPNKLNSEQRQAFQPGASPCKLYDGGGLYLLVKPNGAKYWRLKYRYDGKEKSLSLGVYPKVSLEVARAGRDEARHLLAAGGDPMAAKREAAKQKEEQAVMSGNVWEWVEDMHHFGYNSIPTDGSAESVVSEKRVLRGGSWDIGQQGARAANQGRVEPNYRGSSNGFRLARTLP